MEKKQKQQSEKILRQCVGIDVSMEKLSCACVTLSPSFEVRVVSNKEFENTFGGFQGLLRWVNKMLPSKGEIWYNMEATGVYHEEVAYFLNTQNKKVSVMLPYRAKQYAKSLENKSKTDKIDAQMLGRMGVERALSEWKCPDAFMYNLKCLTRERLSLKHDLTIVKNRRHALEHQSQKTSSELSRTEQYIDFLEQQIATVETQIQSHVKTNPEVAQRIEKIGKVKGLGFITIVTVIAETDGFSQVSNVRQLVSYAGLDIKLQESGKWIGQRKVSKKGNANLRAAVYMPSLSASVYNPLLKKQYERVKVRTGSGGKALMPVARKLLVLTYVLWKSGQEYDPNYIHQSAHNSVKKVA